MEFAPYINHFVEDRELFEAILSKVPASVQWQLLANVATKLCDRYEEAKTIDDLNRAIELYEQSIVIIERDNIHYSPLLNDLAVALKVRFHALDNGGDIDRAITLYKEIVEPARNDDPYHASYLLNLGAAYQSRFEQSGAFDDLNEALKMKQASLALTAADDHKRLDRLDTLADSFWSLYELTGSIDDLQQLIMTRQAAASASTSGHPEHFPMLSKLEGALEIKFKQSGKRTDLDQLIQVRESMFDILPKDDPVYAEVLEDLAYSLVNRFELTSSTNDLDRAIELYEDLIENFSVKPSGKARALGNLCISYQYRFEQIDSIRDIERALEVIQRSLELEPNNPERVKDFAVALVAYALKTNSDNDLDEAIRLLESISEIHPHYVGHLNNLGLALQCRFERAGDVVDLYRAIDAHETALRSSEKPNPIYIQDLARALHIRYEREGTIHDLQRAMDMSRQSIDMVAETHHHLLPMLNNHSNLLQDRYNRNGEMEDLENAISIREKIVALASSNHVNYSMYLNNLTTALELRFLRTGSTDDLDRAIALLSGLGEEDPDRISHLNNLCNVLQSRFERTGSKDDLDEAILSGGELLVLAEHADPSFPMYLNGFSNALLCRYDLTKSLDDLLRAITALEQAVELSPPAHSNRNIYQHNLGNALGTRCERTGSIEDLNRAIEHCKQSSENIPDDSPARASRLSSLGELLFLRFNKTQAAEDLSFAIEATEKAVNSETSPPSMRVQAAKLASKMLIGRDWDRVKGILQTAVRILPTVSARTLNDVDKQYNIAQFAGITSQAVAVSLQCGTPPAQALQLCELGRGVLASARLAIRSDISVLEENYPEIAKRFRNLRDRLDRPRRPILSANPFSDESQEIRVLSKQYEDELKVIRSLPGFSQFFLGPSVDEIQEMACFGPIVVFNISEFRSDAFLITQATGIRSIGLDSLKHDELESYCARFLLAIYSLHVEDYNKAKLELSSVLVWLWNAAVKPILEEIGFTGTPQQDEIWPRIWWVGNGLLNMLPLHAAGYHNGSSMNALDRVISSYSPSIRAIEFARNRQSRAERPQAQRVLIVGMPTTPDEAELKSVRSEVQAICGLAHSEMTCLLNPTKENVLSHMKRSQIVHLSCHGRSELDPSKSMLLMEDWKTSPLTVADIASLNLENTEFAFLSACHTASNRDISLADESISLVTAMQLSGFPSVVGTLWQTKDSHASTIALKVYKWMLRESKFEGWRAAEGLHRAIRELRQETSVTYGSLGNMKAQDDPLLWAQYVHLGV